MPLAHASEPRSCDTLVFVAGADGPSNTIFGKNSDRPSDEAHEVVHIPAAMHSPESTVKCTYIEIPQALQTHAVVLSKPSWMWGCEMGANEHGVVGGNEAVSSMLCGEVSHKNDRLLGMDLLRLALERGRTAREATEVCCQLLERHGQGGCCSEDQDGWTYENGFLFADGTEAFVMETAGVHHWAVERIPPGKARNISNGLSIRQSIEACSKDIKNVCKKRGWWDGTSPFDWKACVEAGGQRGVGRSLEIRGREKAGADHLNELRTKLEKEELNPADAPGWVRGMANVLRDEDSGICFRDLHGFCSTGSQISVIPPRDSGGEEAAHFFTASSDPTVAAYKRFVFSQSESFGTTDHDSLELWNDWRELALQGGLHRCYSEEKGNAIREAMSLMEQEAIGTDICSLGADIPTFAAFVKRELSLLHKQKGSAAFDA